MTLAPRGAVAALGVLTVAFALAHLPFLAASLEDIDSVNFALALRDFDVADHRPHPPGYPVYIAIGNVSRALVGAVSGGDEASLDARALAVLSLVGGVLLIVALYRLLSTLGARVHANAPGELPWQALDPTALAATALAAACPLFWYMAARPMSDVPGLAIASTAQACLALAWWRQRPNALGDRRLTAAGTAASGQMIVLGALLSGLAIGMRAQNALLTLPLLGGVLIDRIGRGVAGAMIGSSVALAVGIAVWAVPLLVVSGGVEGYLLALGNQAGEDFSGVAMLYQQPGLRPLAYALLQTFVLPWDSYVLAALLLMLATGGAVRLLISDRRALTAITLLTLPYLLFHLLFHETTFVRYALPLVPAVAYLAVRGLELAGTRAALPLAGALAIVAVAIAAPTLAEYASVPSPTARAVAAINTAAAESSPGALAMHQGFQRPLQAEHIVPGPQLPAPPRREWLELTKYWRTGQTAPLWFLADPRRTDLALIDPQSRQDRQAFIWDWRSLSEMGGMRPAAAHWYRLRPPGWFAEEGWALTPETAGIAQLTGRGPALAPITAWVRRRDASARVLIGGRHLGAAGDPPVRFTLAVDDTQVTEWQVSPGFFVHVADMPAPLLAGEGLARLTIASRGAGGAQFPTAVEQFDLQSQGTLMWAFGDGWHESEYTSDFGLWRWTSERATLRIVGAEGPVVIALRVETPRRYFADNPTVLIKVGEQVVGETSFATGELWSGTVPIAALQRAGGLVTIETDRTFAPPARAGLRDERRLGLRVRDVSIVPQRLTAANVSR